MEKDGDRKELPTMESLSSTEIRIVEAAISNFVRYGVKKTTMADIAKEAEVSRQTLYAAFGAKDDLIIASILYISRNSLIAVRKKLADCKTLGEQLDAYFAQTIIKSFHLLESSHDAEDLVSGHNKAGRRAIEQSHLWHRAFIADILIPHAIAIGKTHQTPAELAHFIVAVVMSLKYEAKTRAELDKLLYALKVSVLMTTGQMDRP